MSDFRDEFWELERTRKWGRMQFGDERASRPFGAKLIALTLSDKLAHEYWLKGYSYIMMPLPWRVARLTGVSPIYHLPTTTINQYDEYNINEHENSDDLFVELIAIYGPEDDQEDS